MRGLAAEDEHPPHASRPFDATRAGFVMGEGAGALAARGLGARRARGATIYAEVLGYGASNDAHHMAQPEPEATGVAAMMRARARARRRRAGARRLHQRARHLDAARRRRRDEGDQGRLRRPRLRARGLVDEVDDGPHASARPARSRRSCACSRCATACCRRRSTTASPDPECDLDYVPNEARAGAGRRRALERDGPRRPQRLRAARPRGVTLTLVRHATLLLETSHGRVLVDPMLRAAGTTPPIENTPNQVPNPLVEPADPGRGRRRGRRPVHRHPPARATTSTRQPRHSCRATCRSSRSPRAPTSSATRASRDVADRARAGSR